MPSLADADIQGDRLTAKFQILVLSADPLAARMVVSIRSNIDVTLSINYHYWQDTGLWRLKHPWFV
jgi:hypothetical protein